MPRQLHYKLSVHAKTNKDAYRGGHER